MTKSSELIPGLRIIPSLRNTLKNSSNEHLLFWILNSSFINLFIAETTNSPFFNPCYSFFVKTYFYFLSSTLKVLFRPGISG